MKNYFKATSEVDVFALPDSSSQIVRTINSGEFIPFKRVVYRNNMNWYKCESESGDSFYVRENWGNVQMKPYILKDLYVTGIYSLTDASLIEVFSRYNHNSSLKEIRLERKVDFGNASNQQVSFFYDDKKNDFRTMKLKQGFELYVDPSILAPAEGLIYITNLKGKGGFVLDTIDLRSNEDVLFKTTTYFIQILAVLGITLLVLWQGWLESGVSILGISIGVALLFFLLHSVFVQVLRSTTKFVFRRI